MTVSTRRLRARPPARVFFDEIRTTDDAAITKMNKQFQVGSDGRVNGAVESDNSLRDVQSMLLGAISYCVTGKNGIVNIASIGVDMNDHGTLTVDDSKLSSDLSSNFSMCNLCCRRARRGSRRTSAQSQKTFNAPNPGILSIDSKAS